jgi:hypothetical protein
MYFIKNANEGGECLCSGAYDPALPSDRYKLSLSPVVVPPTDQQQYSISMTPASAHRSASYMKTPAAAYHTAHKYQHESSQMMPTSSRRAAACSVPPAPASYQRAAAGCAMAPTMAPASYQRAAAGCAMAPASYQRAAAAAAYRPRQPARRVAMLREPVAMMTKRRALYEDTESSRPFDYMVDYGNTYGGYSGEPQTIDPPTIPSTDDLFFNPGTIDQTSEQYKEALRLYYDKLGYPNFTPKNGYDYGMEFFDKSGLQSVPLRTPASYGTISKF